MNKLPIKHIIVSVLILVIVFFCGRYSAPEKIKTEIKTVEIEKIVTQVQKKTIRIKENSDGSKETSIDVDTTTAEQSKGKSKFEQQEIIKKSSNSSIAILVGTTYPLSGPHYGISIQRTLIGPINFGVWGLTNANAGISLGINF
jgi:hypothetical protein